MPTVADLRVFRKDSEVLEVYSHLTRGLCATVYKFEFSAHYSIQPFLIPSYMQGITHTLIAEAVAQFVENENKQKEN